MYKKFEKIPSIYTYEIIQIYFDNPSRRAKKYRLIQ